MTKASIKWSRSGPEDDLCGRSMILNLWCDIIKNNVTGYWSVMVDGKRLLEQMVDRSNAKKWCEDYIRRHQL